MSVDPRQVLADRRRPAEGEPHWPTHGDLLYAQDPDYRALVDAGLLMIDGLVEEERGMYIHGWRAYDRALRRRKRRLPRGEHPIAVALRRFIGPGGPPPEEAVIECAMSIYGQRLPGI